MTIKDTFQRWMADPPPDRLFEIAESSLAACSPRSPGQPRCEVLPERGLTASPSTPNLSKAFLYRDVLPRISPLNGKRRPTTAIVIPDYAARMSILDFQEFPASEAERAALIRFRLRKSVPFHIDEAQLSYAVQIDEPKRVEVLAVAIARPILEEYETVFTEAGYRVGLVVPSSLAALGLCDAAQPGLTLLVKAAGDSMSVVLFEQGQVRLVRCLDLTGNEAEAEHPADGDFMLPLLQQTLAYAEDQLGRAVGTILLCGFGADSERIGRLAQQEFGVAHAPLRSRFGAASKETAGLLGLLERYAA